MLSIAKDLAALLDGVQRPGDFYASGTHEISAPGLEIEGVGPIALPLLTVQAEQLVVVTKRPLSFRGGADHDRAIRKTTII